MKREEIIQRIEKIENAKIMNENSISLSSNLFSERLEILSFIKSNKIKKILKEMKLLYLNENQITNIKSNAFQI